MRWIWQEKAWRVLPRHALLGFMAAIVLIVAPIMTACGGGPGGAASPGQSTAQSSAPHSGSPAGGPSPGQATAPSLVPHSGHWVGRTSQGKPISLSVLSDLVVKLSIQYVHSGSACTVSSASIQVDTLDIIDGKFTFAEGADQFGGNFKSGTKASGAAQLAPATADKAACQAANITWNAQWTGE